ncbi:Ig-like domain-containing protein [Chryseobacterium sp. Hurlbut01]|uniref:Ig-like domain-containing protein n=1 Tax=Chryseobacterium sp. Hurlbut01 TaxID=1681828 RepID=UPI000AFEB048|nr:Ig-like domain-containing protein [Chryseobacterium sp. Hurlbut01]
MKNKMFYLVALLFFSVFIRAQGVCNDYSKWVSGTHTVTAASSSGLFGDHWSGKNNITDASTSNSASWSAILLGAAWIESQNAATLPSGSYAGMVVDDLDLVSLGASMKVSTYMNGVEQESRTYVNLIGTILDGGKRKLGFYTTKPFNRIRLTVNAGLTLIFTARVYYAETIRPCEGAALACNTDTPLVRPAFGAIIEDARTGLSGISVGAVTDTENVVDGNAGNYGWLSLNASILGSAKMSVRDIADTFAAGTFAGFDVENPNLISLTALSNVTIRTYLNGVQQESKSGTAQLLSLPVLSNSGRTIIGFTTTKAFNEVQIELNQLAGVSLGATKVYSAVVKKYCEAAALECNKQAILSRSTAPVDISISRTGITGVASVLASVNNPDNVIDNNTNNYASLILPVTAGTTASVAVKKSLAPYPAGTYAGFDISNPSLINAALLQNVTLRTYRNGALQETISGNGILLNAGTSLIADSGRYVLGFVAKYEFDELQISVNSLVGVNIGTTNVYGMVVMKPCAKSIDCNSSYYWTQPDFPVVLNAKRTGLTTLVSAGSSVNNPDNVIDSNPANYSRITIAAGALTKGSISVMDPTSTYPKGTFAGYTVKDRYFLVQGDLLEFITVRTYLNGVLQESKTSADLLDLTLLIPVFGTGTKNVGFYTTKPFNEVQIETISLANIINILDVYGVFIDTRHSDTNSGGINCTSAVVANNDTYTVPAAGGNTASVLANDTYNGNPATTANVTLAGTSVPAGLTLNADGTITVAAGTPAGTYNVEYKICDKSTPAVPQCDTATAAVTVSKAVIVANDDSYTVTASGGTTASVLVNDTYNGNPATPADVTVTEVGNLPTGFVVNADGTITVAAGTQDGTYNVEYQICDKAAGGDCKTATATITVSKAVLVANNDSFEVVTTGNVAQTTPSVLLNDTYNSAQATTGNVTVTPVGTLPAGFTMNPDGTLTVAGNTAGGTYTITYQICDNVLPGNCTTGTTTATVGVKVPDMTVTQIAFSKSVIRAGETMQVFYTVKNIGNEPTSGLITFMAMKPAGSNTFVANSLVPAGWNATGTTFTTNNVMQPGEEVILIVDYTLISGSSGTLVPFIGRILNGSGGETKIDNNVKNATLIIN